MEKKRGKIEPFTIILFGSTGDLTKRKLIPALYELYKKGVDFNIIGMGRRPWKDQHYRTFVTSFLKRPKKLFVDRISYFIADFQDKGKICMIPSYLSKNLKKNIICYLAVAPHFFAPIVEQLDHCGFVEQHRKKVSVVFEKPFGHDLKSAKKLNKEIRKLFDEKQIYRIDHYLGKEAVQNLVLLRFSNPVFQNDWNGDSIEKIEIYAHETVGVGTRGGYYDETGAFKDMVQNHLMQTLSLVTMDKPKSFSEKDVRDAKVKVVKSLKKVDLSKVVRGQYVGYTKEDKIAKGSDTETYVKLQVEVNNPRWKGVPITIETGKMLHNREAGVKVYFKAIPNIFGFPIVPNKIDINIQPRGDINCYFNTKEVGTEMTSKEVKMNFSTATEFGTTGIDAYEKMIHDIATGDQTLFTRADEIEASWKFIDAIVKKWKKIKLKKYKKGSRGP
jgi:glucose-6-phosphate 1-dehydrogenase